MHILYCIPTYRFIIVIITIDDSILLILFFFLLSVLIILSLSLLIPVSLFLISASLSSYHYWLYSINDIEPYSHAYILITFHIIINYHQYHLNYTHYQCNYQYRYNDYSEEEMKTEMEYSLNGSSHFLRIWSIASSDVCVRGAHSSPRAGRQRGACAAVVHSILPQNAQRTTRPDLGTA